MSCYCFGVPLTSDVSPVPDIYLTIRPGELQSRTVRFDIDQPMQFYYVNPGQNRIHVMDKQNMIANLDRGEGVSGAHLAGSYELSIQCPSQNCWAAIRVVPYGLNWKLARPGMGLSIPYIPYVVEGEQTGSTPMPGPRRRY